MLKLKEMFISIIIILITLVSIGVLKLIETSASSSLSSLASSAEIPLNDTNKNKSISDIPHIYPTKPNGEIYRFNNTQPNDLNQVNETEDPTVFSHKNSDNSWRVDNGKTRIEAFTKSAGTLSEEEMKERAKSWNYDELQKIGYWINPDDWRNIEVTMVFKFINSNTNSTYNANNNKEHDISIVTRSLFHDSESAYSDKNNNNNIHIKDLPHPYYCGGSSYHNNISNEGHVKMKKEQFHVKYNSEDYDSNVNLGNLDNKIIGVKAMVFNSEDNKKVKLETWVDTVNQGKGPYKKVHELIDKGKWGKSMKICGANKKGDIISWGSPDIVIKTNDNVFDIFDMEVQEIIPPKFS
jgi:hypothetical protein